MTELLRQAIAQSDVNVRLAELDLVDVREGASDAELAAAYAAVRDARVELEAAQHAYTSTLNSAYDSSVRSRSRYTPSKCPGSVLETSPRWRNTFRIGMRPFLMSWFT